MERTPQRYRTLVPVLSCHKNWLDLRHLKTLGWMMTGLILSREISLGAWALYGAAGRSMWPVASAGSVVSWTMPGLASLVCMCPCFIKRSKDGIAARSTWLWTPRCCGIPTASYGCP